MTIEAWKITGYVLAAISAILIPWVYGTRHTGHGVQVPDLSIATSERYIVIVLISIGVLQRVLFLNEFQGGNLTSDEYLMSVIYTSGIVHSESIRFGGEKLVFSLILDAWLKLFGLSAIAIRSLAVFASMVGLVVWFFSLRMLSGERIALWATALLSISAFGAFFGKLGMELYWVLVFGPLCLLVFAFWHRKPSGVTAAFGGFVAGLGLYTYPGFLLGVLALIGSLAVSWIWALFRQAGEDTTPKFDRDLTLGLGLAVGSFLAVTLLGLYLHWTIYSPSGGPIFVGGGHLSHSISAILSAVQQMFKDLLIEGSSWYLLYPSMPFVEVVLWPFFVLGLVLSWRGSENWVLRGIMLSMLAVILLSSVTGAYPGMRRAIYFLLPFYYFSAVGIAQLVEIAAFYRSDRSSMPRTGRRSISVVVPVLVLISLAHPVYYEFTHGRDAVSWNHGEGFGTRKIPLEYLLDILRSRDVVMTRREFDKYFDHLIYYHYPRLAKRYGLIQTEAREVHFLEDEDDPVIASMLTGEDWAFLTWSGKEVSDLSRTMPICVEIDKLQKKSDVPYLAYSQPSESSSEDENCISGGKFKGLDSVFHTGYRHALERLIHGLDCSGPYCDRTRPDFIYTRDGTVEFSLQPDGGQCDNGCDLTFHLLNPLPERSSQVMVEDELIGTLSSEALDSENLLHLSVPRRLIAERNVIVVKIMPTHEIDLGWDIKTVEVTASRSKGHR